MTTNLQALSDQKEKKNQTKVSTNTYHYNCSYRQVFIGTTVGGRWGRLWSDIKENVV